MGKKLSICRGNACKKADPDKRLKKFTIGILGEKK